MYYYYEWGIRQLHKHGEELCGDNVALSRSAGSVIMALSDGLGSGVKASILSILTTQIAIKMLENDMSINEVVQSLSETLPVCNIRKLAYSTFSIAKFYRDGIAKIVDFDSPSPILLRNRRIQPWDYDERLIEDKNIREIEIQLEIGDCIIFVSDGVVNAGIGGAYPLGWGWDQAAQFMERGAHPKLSAHELADKIVQAVSDLYAGVVGDDVSVVAIKVRQKLAATVLTGPPIDKEKDEVWVKRFVSRQGKLVVCGGTTAKIVSRYLGRSLDVDLSTNSPDVPPLARIEGIDLVSEGILTLTKVYEYLKSGTQRDAIKYKTDGASLLLRMLLEVDHIHFIVGQTVNPAHQNPNLPNQLRIRITVVREIIDELRNRGKEVSIELD
jgi:serine/threonine protein phosphatase PrpC